MAAHTTGALHAESAALARHRASDCLRASKNRPPPALLFAPLSIGDGATLPEVNRFKAVVETDGCAHDGCIAC